MGGKGRRLGGLLVGALLAGMALSHQATPWPLPAQGEDPHVLPVMVLEVDGVITGGVGTYLSSRVRAAPAAGFGLVVVRLNTPGGLVSATLEAISAFAESPLPVVVFVAPPGAIAASAGAFLTVGSHLAAMAPGTTVGAAMPVILAPGGAPQPADQKTINFLAGHMRSLARERGRPPETAERFVTENLTLDSVEAVEAGIVQLLASDLGDLMARLEGREVVVAGETLVLRTEGASPVTVPMSAGERVQHFVSDPQLAFLLLLGGAYAVYLGLTLPGTLVPEVLGAVALVLGIYGLGLFENSLTGLVLMAMGLAFLVGEAFTPTFGVLGAGGALSLLLGALLLPREPMLPGGWFTAFRATVVGAVAVITAITFGVVGGLVRSRRGRPRHPVPEVGPQATVLEALDPLGSVRVGGESWSARAVGAAPIAAGTRVRVLGREGLLLVVEPWNKGGGGGKNDPPLA
ncbi:MAG: nodulation protein NfeD [bacterium]|nr:nodulation protein NfeD [bacterium]